MKLKKTNAQTTEKKRKRERVTEIHIKTSGGEEIGMIVSVTVAPSGLASLFTSMHLLLWQGRKKMKLFKRIMFVILYF